MIDLELLSYLLDQKVKLYTSITQLEHDIAAIDKQINELIHGGDEHKEGQAAA